MGGAVNRVKSGLGMDCPPIPERYMQENIAGKYFCGFSLTDKTPNYTSYSKMRARIGASQLSKNVYNGEKTIIKQGYIGKYLHL